MYRRSARFVLIVGDINALFLHGIIVWQKPNCNETINQQKTPVALFQPMRMRYVKKKRHVANSFFFGFVFFSLIIEGSDMGSRGYRKCFFFFFSCLPVLYLLLVLSVGCYRMGTVLVEIWDVPDRGLSSPMDK